MEGVGQKEKQKVEEVRLREKRPRGGRRKRRTDFAGKDEL